MVSFVRKFNFSLIQSNRKILLRNNTVKMLRKKTVHFFFFILNTKFKFQGSQYSVASDLWSLGLSLVEISLGMYPIPPPDRQALVALFGQQAMEEVTASAVAQSSLPKTPRTPRSPAALPGGVGNGEWTLCSADPSAVSIIKGEKNRRANCRELYSK